MKSKKALAIVLAIAMIFGVVSMASAASSLAGKGFADSQDSKQADAIAYLRAFGVLKGDAGTNNVRPDDALTREEFVIIVARATGNEATANGLAGYPTSFVDADAISDWAVGAVNLATGQGWIRGYEDGSFQPKGNLTMAEAITVLVRVTGHEMTVPTSAVWPVGHIMKGNQVGVNAGVKVDGNAPITRQDMARLTYNSLFIDTVVKDAEGKTGKGDSLASLYTVTGAVSSVNSSDEEIVIDDGDGDVTYDLAKEVTLLGGNTLNALNGLTVRATFNLDNEAYILEVLKGGVASAQVLKEKKDVSTTGATLVMQDGSSFKVNKDTKFSLNGSTLTAIGDGNVKTEIDKVRVGSDVQATVTGGVASDLVVISLNADDYVLQAAAGTADNDGIRDLSVALNNAGAVTLKLQKGAAIVLNGEAASASDLKAHDVLQLAVDGTVGANAEVHKVVATRQVVTGTVTAKVAKLVKTDPLYQAALTVKLSDGTSKTINWYETSATAAGALGQGPDEDDAVALLLNADGIAAADIATVAGAARFGKVVSLWTGTGAMVDVEINGTIHSIADPDGHVVPADLNSVGAIVQNAAKVTSFTKVADWTAEGEITAIMGDVVIYKVGSTTGVAANPAVFEWKKDNAVGNYLGFSALAVGDKIVVSTTAGTAGNFVLKK